ncbi:MAG: hypothetical protein N3G78_06400 [Desulfobacterota bacterium]|nr:hypothetical protein [Thermodesulfobacteriota bacterium]
MDFDRAHDALTEKLGALRAYLSASQEMKNCLDRQETDQMLRCLATREGLIERINRIDETLDRILKEPFFLVTGREGPEWKGVASLCRSIEETLDQIQKIDQACRERLSDLRSEIGTAIRKVSQERATLHHYRRIVSHPPTLIDLRR